MKNKLVLFDWGNIVESLTTGYTLFDAMNNTYKQCGYKGVDGVYLHLRKYRLTAITSMEEFEKTYNKIKEELNLNKTFEEFKKIYYEEHDKIDYYKNVRDYEHSLKDKCYIGILSNLNILDGIRLDKEVDKSKYDYVFLSYELGYRKPDIEVFEKIMKSVPFKSEDILLVDDKLENTQAAASLGWSTITATGLELDKIKKGVEDFLNK